MRVIKKQDNKIGIVISDCFGKKTVLNFDLDEIDILQWFEISGDECIEAYYKNGGIEWNDSSNNRVMSYFDGNKIIYYNGKLRIDEESDE